MSEPERTSPLREMRSRATQEEDQFSYWTNVAGWGLAVGMPPFRFGLGVSTEPFYSHLRWCPGECDTNFALAGLTAGIYTDPATAGTIIKAVHVSELRAALDAALTALGLTTGAYTDLSLSGIAVKAVHFQELRDRME